MKPVPLKTFLYLRPCTWIWLLLMVLTIMILVVAETGLSGSYIVALLIISMLVKTQIVADYFMGLKNVRWRWRLIISGYLLVVMTMIGLAYQLSVS